MLSVNKEKCPAPWQPYFSTNRHRTINVASRVLTRKNATPLGSHAFQANITLFEIIQNISETNLLTKFHEDWTINVASRVLTRFNGKLQYIQKSLSSDNHLVDGPTYRPTDMSKAIYPLFFEGRHNYKC
ncbi:hypothetical protein DPMN_001573 [Dreissena polymorpha]|uniref:Uncharacterized protein n=1 Tax=Dreissena polymorpha TaxID=45954 RepID=A0A9D4RT65_DREPO|nr:hypothetical protein DPMN_001573 [Dreissena polymorpha]